MTPEQLLFDMNPAFLNNEAGTWVIRFHAFNHRRFVRFVHHRGSLPRVTLDLTDEIREWLERHDPGHSVRISVRRVRLEFSSEDTAMFFRLTFGVPIGRC